MLGTKDGQRHTETSTVQDLSEWKLMRKPDTLNGEKTAGEWWKHLKYMKRVVHKAERQNWKKCLRNGPI